MQYKVTELNDDAEEIGVVSEGNIPEYIQAEALEQVNTPHSGSFIDCLAELVEHSYAPADGTYQISISSYGRELYRGTP